MSGPEIASIVDVLDCSDHGTDSVQEPHDHFLPTQININKVVKKFCRLLKIWKIHF